MLFHVGISLNCKEVLAYNVSTKQVQTIVIQKPVLVNDNSASVIALFEDIKSAIGDNLGCACIYMTGLNSNDIRKLFIQIGLEFGFKKVDLINPDASIYIGAISQTKYKTKINDIIWIFDTKGVHIWQKSEEKAQFLEFFWYDYKKITWKGNISNIVKLSKLNTPPSVIFYLKNCKIFEECTGLDGLKCEKFPYESLDNRKSALIKARIMANDPDVIHLDTYTVLQAKTSVKINEKEILAFLWPQVLPVTKSITMKRDENQKSVEIGQIQINLPNFDEFLLTFTIDTNEIYDFKYVQLPIIESQIKLVNESITHLIKDQKSIVDNVYNIPRRFNVTDKTISIIGIDLGTSRCCAAVNRKNGIETFALDNLGERLLPSWVSFDERNAKCGQIVMNRLQNYAKFTVFDVKRIIGKPYNDIILDKSWPFELTNENNEVKIQIYGHKSLYPEEISAILLKHIKQKAEEFQGKILNEVVITVPAAFNQAQQVATLAAGRLAGWEIVHLLPEPVAAALAYFVDRPIPSDAKLLIFDLGGGTLDVCIFEVRNNQLQILSRSGDVSLGGRDFDNLLVNYFENLLLQKFNIDVSEKKYKLMLECQSIKHTLSTIAEDHLDVSGFDCSNEKCIVIKRDEFEKMAEVLLQKIKTVILSALKKAGFYFQDINIVFQVGGACRMPMIKRMLEKTFPKALHSCEEHPDEVVAIGAAYYAYYLKTNIADTFLSPTTKIPEKLPAINEILKNINSSFKNAKEVLHILHSFKDSAPGNRDEKSDKKAVQQPITLNPNTERDLTPWFKHTSKIFSIPKIHETFDAKINAIGINLGTTRCYAAVSKTSGIKIVRFGKNLERELESVIAFDDENKEHCGDDVAYNSKYRAKSCVFDAKRIIGRKFDEITIDICWPFEVGTTSHYTKYKQETEKELDDNVLIKIPSSTGVIFKFPEEILAVLLKNIKTNTEDLYKKEVSQAVIAIPASFNKYQKTATRLSAELAGWHNVNFLPEPVAALIAHFIDQPLPDKETILLFDLGAGTLDICIFKVFHNKFQILSNTGDSNIGVRDFQIVLYEYFRNELLKNSNVDITKNDRHKSRLMLECEFIYLDLLMKHSTELNAEDFGANNGKITITNKEFETMSSQLVDKIRELIEKALNEAKLHYNQVNTVVQHGRGCLIPVVETMLNTMFPCSCHSNVFEKGAIALGAAHYAYNLQLKSIENEFLR